jgi:hypothetical protein
LLLPAKQTIFVPVMRKALVISLALVYFAVSSGVVVNLHYCMGKLAGTELGHSSVSDTCGKCGMERDGDCCKDEVKLVKADITANFVNSFMHAGKADITLPDHQQFDYTFSYFNQGRIYSSIHAPPLVSDIPLYIKNCVFRI